MTSSGLNVLDVNWNQLGTDCDCEHEEIHYESAPSNAECRSKFMVKTDPSLKLKARYGYYCLNEELADVYFIVPDRDLKRKIPAHKFVLAVGSPVFKAMFYGPLSNSNDKEIMVPDIDYAAFQTMLRFMYTDECNLETTWLASTLYAAKKYQIINLEEHCINFLIWDLDTENVLAVLTQALLYDEEELAELCWCKFSENCKDVIDAESFLEIDGQVLTMILDRDDLAISEVDLYKAAVRWSESECARRGIPVTAENQRLVLGNALFKIRFPLMTGDEFAFNVANEDILTTESKAAVFSYFANANRHVPFSTQKRAAFTLPSSNLPKKELILTRFQKADSGRACMFDQVHKVDFVVLESVLITGFGVYGTRCPDGERLLSVELHKADTNELLASARTKITCTGKPKIHQVRFNVPAPIEEKTIYTVTAEFDGNYPYPTFYGVKGRRIVSVRHCEENATFIFFKSEGNNFADTGGEIGQIPQVLFCLK